jgi:hypothetical protein
MNKIVIVAGCLLGLALAWIPAYASPTSKKITVTCNSSDGGEVVLGDATVTLCVSLATCTDPTKSVVCPEVLCDSSGVSQPISITVSCDAPFKAGAAMGQVDFSDSEGSTGGSSPSIEPLNGKGFSVSAFPDTNPNDTGADLDGDTENVTLTVK